LASFGLGKARLLDDDLCAALGCLGEVLDAAIDNGPNSFQELDSGLDKMVANLGGHAKALAHLIDDLTA